MENPLTENEAMTVRPFRRVVPDSGRERRHSIRTGFFVGTGLSGFVLGLLSLSVGLQLDMGRIPFRAWSLVMYLTGACLVIGAGQMAAGLYRKYRRKQG